MSHPDSFWHWLFFAFISFSLILGYFWFTEIRRWKGQRDRWRGLTYEHNGFFARPWHTIRIGVDMPSRVNCQFRGERRFDKWAQDWRLIKEHQTGHADFDDQVFFVSDSRPVQKMVSANRLILDHVLSLKNDAIDGLEFHQVVCRRGRLWVEFYATDGDLSEGQCEDLIEHCVPILHDMAAAFNRYAAYTVHMWKDPIYWKALGLTILSSFLLVDGLLQWDQWHRYVKGQILPNTVLETHAALLTVAGSLGLLVMAVLLMGRSSRTHVVLLGLLPASLFGLYIESLVVLRDLNTYQDPGQTRTVVSKVTDTHLFFWRGSWWLNWNASYLINVQATAQTPDLDVRVPFKTYSQAQPGQAVQMQLHPGKLGYPWVSDPQLLQN
jgi:hypothetical protein